MAVFAGQLTQYDPAFIDKEITTDEPSTEHIIGTDQLGRDNWSRLLYGARISLFVGVLSMMIFIVIGTVLGALAGYCGGIVDALISRLIDIILSFPQLVICLVLVSFLGPGLKNILVTIGGLGWTQIARIVRAEVKKYKTLDFVMASEISGTPKLFIIFREIVPNVFPMILVAATFGVASSILMESMLSFLGMGVQSPTPSWGQMMKAAESLSILRSKFYMWFPPGIMIFLTVISVNFIGEGLREALDPKMKLD
jgi:peptide/nickel transport system permease protein